MTPDAVPSKPGSATAAATPVSGVSASATPPGPRSVTRTSCSAQDKMIGRTVGKARILKRLGRGGMGDVYLCQHPDYDKAAAIKILPPDLTRNEELLQRFRREAESAARLEDPNLVEIFDVGEENGFHYILMAYVDGLNLQEHLDDHGKLDFREAVRIAFEVARGLRAVHSEGIIHRDIKPANILISKAKEVKIVDFGLAFDAEDKTTLTVAGAVMGTPWYLSPEQAEGRRADARSDIYSLGVCLYLMVCGVRPFVGESHMSVLYKQIHERPRDPRFHRPEIPDYLADLVLKALEKKPERRFQSAEEMSRALEAFLKNTYPRKAAAPLPPPPKAAEPAAAWASPRRNPSPVWALCLAGGAALLLAAGAGMLFLSSGRPTPEESASDPGPSEAPAPAEPLRPAVFSGLLSEADERQISERNYAPVLERLLAHHQGEKSPRLRAALSSVGLKLSAAARVTTQYRAVVSAEKAPAIRLRDGRGSTSAAVPLAWVHPESVVEYALRSREVSDLDLVYFLLVDGAPRAAVDRLFLGHELRPEYRPYLDDIVETALLEERGARDVAERLAPVRDRLPASAAARVDAALRK